MKYGNINYKLPTLDSEYAAIEDNLKKEIITEEQSFELMKNLNLVKLFYILKTNKMPIPASSWPKVAKDLKHTGFVPLIVE